MKKPKIVHVLANGKRVKSIEGHVIPGDNPVYEIILHSVVAPGIVKFTGILISEGKTFTIII